MAPAPQPNPIPPVYAPPMRILLTNDDGIRAPGIVALHDALLDATDKPASSIAPIAGAEVFTVAPATVQSATGHGVTFHEPLMTQPVRIHERMAGVAVDGRPADCVKVALSALWPERFGSGSRPDLVVSGMNAGANCGINVIYSGTVAAAIEAAFLGVPSIAVSFHLGHGRPLFDVAARHAVVAIERVIASGLLKAHSCININMPRFESADRGALSEQESRELTRMPLAVREQGDLTDTLPTDKTPPIVICPINTHGLIDKYERRVSPGGDVYYWAAGHGLDFHATDAGTDVAELIDRRAITVTPLTFDLTRHDQLSAWRDALA